MPNLKEVRNRITSVESTQKITSAMKMVSASKLRKAQNNIVKLRPYSQKLNQILQNINSSTEKQIDNKLGEQREINHITLVLISSNRGMCGAFNSNIIKTSLIKINEQYKHYLENNKLSIITIGKKVTEFFSKRGYPVVFSYDAITENPTFEKSIEISEMLLNNFINNKTDKIEIIYNQFKNAASQVLTNEQFLPIINTISEQKTNIEYIYEPSKDIIFEELIPKILRLQFYKSILDSVASEHGARMTAMHKATDNAGELIKTLKLAYNKARQAAITNEISEIVSGANAL